ncbi:hypothetical protein [Pedobacter sp. SL55]|uniref:hypothetical protein n=1 Tax=Pedobacter sp. SL55 TaxID=2995161 RepID=UPI00226DB42F|nr:hypothetical protein [Pedobacter sp. SL55]WAC40199.1 hypothetical protein OVA16_16725 [Pedobacter sp. SL55]
MIKKLIAKSVFSLYDKLGGGKIQANYVVIKAKHEANKKIDADNINKYLLENGFKGKLEDQPLMSKADISKRMATANMDKLHSFAYTGGSYGEPFKIPYSKKEQ